MNKKTKIIIGTLSAFLIVGVISFSLMFFTDVSTSNPITGVASAEKQAAPNFTVVDIQGNPAQLADFIGKPIVLNFWASWCPPCKSEMPHFNKVYEEEKDNIVFLMVDLIDGSRETVEVGQKYIDKSGFTFPVYFDTTGEASNVYRISALPTTVFIDREGNVISKSRGAISENHLRTTIEKIR